MYSVVKGTAMMLSQALSLVIGPSSPLLLPPCAMGTLPSALDVTPSAFITVNVPWGMGGFYPLTLQVEVEESDDVCGPASIKLNGQTLNYNAKGYGVGSLQLDDDTIISADWDFRCIGPEDSPSAQSMRFNIKAVEDVGLTEEASLTIVFRSTAPVRILEVEGAAHMWSLSLPFNKKNTSTVNRITSDNSPRPIWEYPDRDFQDPEEELQVELMEIDALHEKVLQLEKLATERQASISKKLSKSCRPVPPSSLAEPSSATWFRSYLRS
ncbi:hypothetical protein NW762_008997 [Fusarium torreyae]|uniref:Uncharacterized protein n=1 Tax=Fusarium torreyae TaxID=1237075 RepID=A0A9W8RY64_9HYPO|nr:hypothetical protein NW762_008997 [Fusarium torreyae]